MQGTTLSFANMHNHGELFANILHARRESSTIRSQWKLPAHLGAAYDQYDTPQTRWLAVQGEDGEVLAGARLTPTTAQCGIYSYMIRDAQNGLLSDIPTDVLDARAPAAEHIWEVTRGFVAAGLPARERHAVRLELVNQMMRTAREEGITQMLALLPANWTRWAQMCRFGMTPAGQKVKMGRETAQAVWIDCASNLH